MSPELVRGRARGTRRRTKWQQPFDASLTDVFQVQADIATKVASALDVALGDSARRELAAKPTANLAAYDAYPERRGRLAGDGRRPIRRACAGPSASTSRRSRSTRRSSPAWAQLARARSLLYFNGTPDARAGGAGPRGGGAGAGARPGPARRAAGAG